MQRVVLPDFNPASLAAAVGATSYARGAQYARQKAVVHAQWDPVENALRGMVRGSADNFYATAAYFSMPSGSPPEFEHGEGSCPVGVDCKHAGALILTATGALRTAPRESPRPAPWSQSLDSLLGDARGPAPSPGETPLAIELMLSGSPRPAPGHRSPAAGAPLKLLARLVRAGKSGGWVSGGLVWSRLDSLYYGGDYPDPQVRLVREMYALY